MYRIGEFSKMVGVPIKTLRYYDEINLFKPSYIDRESGYRYYEDGQVKDLTKILELKNLGLSLDEIKKYISDGNLDYIYNKEKNVEENLANIQNYLNGKTVYKIYEGNYDMYLKLWGWQSIGTPEEEDIKNNRARHFVIEKNGEIYWDILVYEEDYNVLCGLTVVEDSKLFIIVVDYLLKQGYDKLKLVFDDVNWEIMDNFNDYMNVKEVGNEKEIIVDGLKEGIEVPYYE